jgi:hypothetical protein
MSEALIISIINLVAKVGFDAAISVINGLKNSKTIDDALTALEASKSKSWEDFKREALPPPP